MVGCLPVTDEVLSSIHSTSERGREGGEKRREEAGREGEREFLVLFLIQFFACMEVL